MATKAAEKEKKKKLSKKDSGDFTTDPSNQHTDSNERVSNELYRQQYQSPQQQQQQQYQVPVQQFQQPQPSIQQIQQEILASQQKLHYEAQLKQHFELQQQQQQQLQQQQLQQKPHYEPYPQKVEQLQQQQLPLQKVEEIQQQLQQPQLPPPKVEQLQQQQQLPLQKVEQLQQQQPPPPPKVEQIQQFPSQKVAQPQKIEQQQYQAPQPAAIPPPIKTDDKFKIVNVEPPFKHETPPLNVVKNDIVSEVVRIDKTPKVEPDEEKVNADSKSEAVIEKVEKPDKDVAADVMPTQSGDPGSTQPKAESDTKPLISSGNNTKKGTLWALPIVPKLPVKPAEKRPTSLGLAALPVVSLKKIETPRSATTPTADVTATSPSSATCPITAANSTAAPLADVWRQAFGAAKPKKPADPVAVPVRAVKQEPATTEAVVKKDEKTYLDIPPEIRRRPKPTFGGLIHFSPDWERSVRTHHEQCRLPTLLTKRIQVHPKILSRFVTIETYTVRI